MTKEQIEQRITVLEAERVTKTTAVSELRIQLSTKQAEALELQRQITENTWENTDDYREYQDLKIALSVISR